MNERAQVAAWVNEAREAGAEWMRIRTEIVASLLESANGAGDE